MKNASHIFIIDDNANNLQITGKILKDKGYKISLAMDGPSALKQLETEIPDLILLDVMMPGMDGLEVCRKIKKNENLEEIPIIFLTAKNQTEDLLEGFKAGGVDYITKPFISTELITRVKTHLELYHSRKTIMEMNRTRDKIYSIIAHDIRAPLSSIKFTTNALLQHYLDPNSEEFTEIIKTLAQTTDETLGLLENLLTWGRLQSNKIKMKHTMQPVLPMLNECKILLDSNAKAKNIKLKLETTSDETTALFDEVTMHTVIRNLIANAIKFTPEGGSVFISTARKLQQQVIKIEDTGIGMDKETINKIFGKKEHFTTKGTKDEKGTGLGLLMAIDFIEKNNATLKVDSTPGKGTSFSIFLPTENSQYLN
jgi:two-component system, sensor histidine kinase and response regulator